MPKENHRNTIGNHRKTTEKPQKHHRKTIEKNPQTPKNPSKSRSGGGHDL